VLVDGSFPLAPTCPDYSAFLSGCLWLSVYVDALCPVPSPLAKVSTGTRPDGNGTGQRASRHIDKHEQSGLFASLCSGFSRGMTPCEPPLQVPRRHGIRSPVRPSIVVKMLISGFWEEAEVKVKIMSPYWRPSRRNLKKDFDGINLRGVPITMVGKALWARD
jgi:hypothetical protein